MCLLRPVFLQRQWVSSDRSHLYVGSSSGLIWPLLWGPSQRNQGFGNRDWLGRPGNVLEMKPPMYEVFHPGSAECVHGRHSSLGVPW